MNTTSQRAESSDLGSKNLDRFLRMPAPREGRISSDSSTVEILSPEDAELIRRYWGFYQDLALGARQPFNASPAALQDVARRPASAVTEHERAYLKQAAFDHASIAPGGEARMGLVWLQRGANLREWATERRMPALLAVS